MKNNTVFHIASISVKCLLIVSATLFFFSCSSRLDNTYGPTYSPPKHTGTVKKAPSGKPGGKPVPTQRPYKIKGIKYTPIASASGFVQTGRASWYGKKFHGRKTSNGERYDMYAMTAAHKTLPMNTWVRVHNLENGKKIVVRINDRGPFVRGRIIDLSKTGAKRIGIFGPGTAKVRVTALGQAVSYSKTTKNPVRFKAVDYYKGDFTVQVGAFQVKANAERYRSKLSRSYKNAHMVKYTDDRGVFYRVRIGRFTNLKDADRFREKIISQGLVNAFTVAE